MRSTRTRTHKSPRAVGTPGLEPLEQRTLMAAPDPVTTDNPVWFAGFGTASTDGVINASEWASSTPVTRALANRPDTTVTLRMMFNQSGLFIAVDTRDKYLWADGNGGGTGARAEFWQDDSIALFFDPQNTQRRFLPDTGRMLALNPGKLMGPFAGSGMVSRWDWLKGNGSGGSQWVMPEGGLTTKIRWKTQVQGTVNNNSDIDTGWTSEIFIPWDAMGLPRMPSNGQFIGMNFESYFDDTGGTRDTRNLQWSASAAERFGPRILDDEIHGVASSWNTAEPGLEGPVNYAQLVFVDQRAADAPSMPVNLSAGSITGYGARLNFLAPYASGANRGSVDRYEIRVSELPIQTADDFDSARVVSNSFVPKQGGKAESLRIAGLEPGNQYYVAVRGVDTAGREGAFNATSFTTLNLNQDTTGGQRVLVSPDGGYLQTETGQPYVIVGNHAVVTSLYVRNLYPGPMWEPVSRTFINYNANPGGEGTAGQYFDSLAATGVNTLRVPMEWLQLDAAARTQLPNGMLWLEYPAGNYNLNARQYLWNMMSEAARTGIKLILHPFSTFNYRQNFSLSAYARQNGGPLNSIDDFFQTPAVLTMSVNRVKTLMDWINQGPNPEAVAGIELLNEWDDWTWTLNARGNSDPNRTMEMRDRARFMTNLARQAKAYDPDVLIMSSSIGLVPRGPIARALFTSDAFDVLAPHLYTTSTNEPIFNPASDRSVQPVTDLGALAAYWMTNRRDNKPIHNGEWGLVRWSWPTGKVYYTGVSSGAVASNPWTVQNDVDLYRSTSWTQIASGLAGNGLRLGGQEMRDLIAAGMTRDSSNVAMPFPQGMRDIQASVSAFVQDTTMGFDFTTYNASTLAGRVRLTGGPMNSVGSTDGRQGLLYVSRDTNRSSAPISGGSASIEGLTSGDSFSIEFWSTGTGAGAISSLTGVTVVNGRLNFNLPTLARDVMIKFVREA